MQSPRPIVKSLRVGLHLLKGAALTLGTAGRRRLGLSTQGRADKVRRWHAGLCRVLGIEVKVTGELVPGALLVANHVSWLDIPVLGSQGRIGFVAKAEVKHWPLIGWMADVAGTLFIARGASRTAVLIPQIETRLREGGHIIVFPEGTTTDGTRLGRFHPRLFAAGQQEGIAVQPVALRYGTGSSPDPIAPFVGDDALLPHLFRVLARPGLAVKVEFLPPLTGSGLARRQLCDDCRDRIARALGLAPDGQTVRSYAAPMDAPTAVDRVDPGAAASPSLVKAA